MSSGSISEQHPRLPSSGTSNQTQDAIEEPPKVKSAAIGIFKRNNNGCDFQSSSSPSTCYKLRGTGSVISTPDNKICILTAAHLFTETQENYLAVADGQILRSFIGVVNPETGELDLSNDCSLPESFHIHGY